MKELISIKKPGRHGLYTGAIIIILTICLITLLIKAPDSTPNSYSMTISNSITMGRILDSEGTVIAAGVDINKETYNKSYAESMSNLIGPGIQYSEGGNYTATVKFSDILYGMESNHLLQLNPLNRSYGGDVQLTVDANTQKFAYEVLSSRNYTGSIMVMNYKTGEIIAAASTPGYNISNPKAKQYGNTCFNGSLMLGSTIKPLLFASALDMNSELANYTYNCNSKTHKFGASEIPIGCAYGAFHGKQNMTDALVNSCNGYALTLANSLDSRKLRNHLAQFGFDQSNVLPNGLMFNDLTYQGSKANSTDKLMAAIGGANCRGSLVALARAYSALFNEGVSHTPYILAASSNKSGGNLLPTEGGETIRMCKKKTARKVLSMMKEVVQRGTLKELKSLNIPLAGKTGTANYDEQTNVLWTVAGVLNKDTPYMVITCIDKTDSSLTSLEAGKLTALVIKSIT